MQAVGADRRGRSERGRYGAWLMAGGQATIERSKIVACYPYFWRHIAVIIT